MVVEYSQEVKYENVVTTELEVNWKLNDEVTKEECWSDLLFPRKTALTTVVAYFFQSILCELSSLLEALKIGEK